MANAEYYRQKAEYCEARAAEAPDELKSDWLSLAGIWEEMAAGTEATALMARIERGLHAGRWPFPH
jgi:hypothetical protein